MNLLFELLLEELPNTEMVHLEENVYRLVDKTMNERKIPYSNPIFYLTPRRMALKLDFEEKTKQENMKIIGPPKNVCYKNGKPTKALEGFLRKNNASEEDLMFENSKKGEYAVIIKKGEILDTRPLIIEAIKEIFSGIHFYKKISRKDLEPIYKVLHNYNWNIPVIVISINKTLSRDYVAFDMSSDNLMPQSGSIIPIGRSQYLLFNNTRYSKNEKVSDYPFPIKLTFSASDEELLGDKLMIKELIDQVYQFSRMYWKSVRQQNLPVTIKYPEMVAEIYPFFKNDNLPPFGQKNLWFL